MFRFDQRDSRQRRAAGALVLVVPAAALAYLPLDYALSSVLGGFWGELGALVMSGAPVAVLFRMAEANRRPRQAVLDGVLLALAGAGLYALTFGGSWSCTAGAGGHA